MNQSVPTWLQASYTKSRYTKEPKWLFDFRREHWDAFLKQGLPTRHHERWKYTDLSFLANKNFLPAKQIENNYLRHVINQHRLQLGNSILLVFVNGYFVPQFSDINKLFPGVIACSINEAIIRHEHLIKMYWPHFINAQHHPFASLNAAVFADGTFFYLPDSCELSMPVHLLSVATDLHEFMAHPHHLMVLGQHSKLMFVEEFVALSAKTYLINNSMTIFAGKGAKLEHVKIQNESQEAIHLSHTLVKQMQDSNTVFMNFSSGSLFARDDLSVKLLEPGSNCITNGFYHLRHDNQLIDHHIDIDHIAPRSRSNMLYKGILEGKSRAVFNGRLHVEKAAQKILAHQANHNLLLSPDAEVYSKPELEIYAEDVVCKHGATTGQLSLDALFYLRSRGMSQNEAMSMLLQGFAEEILQQITYPGVKQRVKKMV